MVTMFNTVPGRNQDKPNKLPFKVNLVDFGQKPQ